MTPRLRSHVQVTRQFYRGKRWFIAHDPTSNQFYRLSPVGYDLVGTLDGKRTVEEAWQIGLTKFGDDAPTQPEVIELLAQLYNSNLLQVDTTPETEQLLRRGKTRTQKRLAQQALSIMYFRLRLLNPDRLLTAVEPIFRPVINRWGMLAWLAVMIYAIASIVPEWPRLMDQSTSLTNPSNWGWVMLVYVLLKLWHELGHGVICKRFGGQVPEAGVMLLVLLPSPFVDASSAWSFASKWQRMAVGAGGMLFELFAAAVASIVWLSVPTGSLASELSFYVMFSASVATVLFNANPLMKFDGYYMLSDWLEIPNLMQRSQQLLKNFFLKHVYRVEKVKPVTTLPGERAVLLVYGLLSQVYRVVVFLSITLWLLGTWFGVGLILAVWSAAVWFIVPAGGLVVWLASSPQLSEKRTRAIFATAAMLGLAFVLVGVVRLPDWRRATGIVDAEDRAGVFALADGFVREAHARPGQRVEKGEPILTLESPDLLARTAQTRAEIAETEAKLRSARAEADNASKLILARELAAAREALAELERQAQDLVVVSPRAGVVAAGDPRSQLGKMLKKGDPVCIVLEPGSARLLAVMDQTEASWLFDRQQEVRVESRLASDVPRVIVGSISSIVPAGQSVLPHPSLGFAGGGRAEIDTKADPNGRIAKSDRFSVYIDTPAGALENAQPGQRVFMRFTLPSKPIAAQVLDRLRKAVQGRVNL